MTCALLFAFAALLLAWWAAFNPDPYALGYWQAVHQLRPRRAAR